ncbi:MAG: FmdE family protein [Anaerolineales bacterium]
MNIKPFPSPSLDELLSSSARHHRHLCPRQVLGVRFGLLAGKLLDIPLPQTDKRLLTIAETDGCFVDGISASTGCYVGRRTMRIEDYGKIAATFVDTLTEQAVRIAPQANIRQLAWDYAFAPKNKWHAQLLGYQWMPDTLLARWQWVELKTPIKEIVSKAGLRVHCEACGEEIINQREVMHEGMTLCKPCAGQAYFVLSL